MSLHVMVSINGYPLEGALVDIEASLNVLPLPIMFMLKINEDLLQLTSMTIAAYDQSKHPIHGKLILEVRCGPKSVPIDFAWLTLRSHSN